MKKVLILSVMSVLMLFVLSCGDDNDESCTQNEDCESGVCDKEKGECVPGNNSDENDANKGGGNSGGDNGGENSGGNGDGNNGGSAGDDPGQGGIYVTCTPGERRECYEGPSGTSDVGICRKGYMECVEDGTDWSECRDQVLPKAEICNDGIDQNCDGEDATPGNVADIDGDGFNYCSGDCCETEWECAGLDPKRVSPVSFEIPNNGIDDNCDGHIDEEIASICDSGINPDTVNPLDLAASMDICPVEITTYGVVSAKLLFPDGTIGDIPKQQYAVLSGYGNNLKPNAGMTFLALSTGSVAETSSDTVDNKTESQPPQDWFQANGGQTFPDSPGCQGQQSDPGKPPVNDPVMLELTIRAPNNAEAFSVDVYYFSTEFPAWVCRFNDFFVLLLDSNFTTDKAEYQNPFDKNIARDENGNPCGINLATSGLFKVCKPRPAYQSCQGDGELAGTLFGGMTVADSHGATGWLEVRGNIVPNEEFKLRMAIWDTNDHALDSMVLLDNFKWYESARKPGISPK